MRVGRGRPLGAFIECDSNEGVGAGIAEAKQSTNVMRFPQVGAKKKEPTMFVRMPNPHTNIVRPSQSQQEGGDSRKLGTKLKWEKEKASKDMQLSKNGTIMKTRSGYSRQKRPGLLPPLGKH